MKFNMRNFALGFAIAWSVAVGSTLAYNPGDFINGTYVQEGSYNDTRSAAVQNSTIVTERRVTTVATEAQTNMVLSQISDRLGSVVTPTSNSVSVLPQAGGNAGAGDHRGSIWVRTGIDNMKEDNITKLGGWNANLWTIAIGYDYKISDKVLAGAALTYSNLKGTTKFNAGNIRDNAYGIVPYVAFILSPCFDIDVIAGYSRVNKSRDRLTPSLVGDPNVSALTGARATSSPKSDRYFGSVFANYKHFVNRWNLLARLGYLYANDKQKAFKESNVGQQNMNVNSLSTSLSRVSLRLQAGYKANQQVEPYIFLTYARDFGASKIRGVPDSSGVGNVGYVSPNKRRNDNTYGGGLGLNGNLGNNWKAGIEGSYARSDKKFRVFGGTLRVSKVF